MTSQTRGSRRSPADMEALREAIYQVCSQHQPVTVRQVFYRLVSNGLVAKTESEYKGTVCRLMAEMRRSGDLPFSWIADNTRWMRKPRTWDGMDHMLAEIGYQYRRDLWASADVEIEIWLEKEALAGVLGDVCNELAVPLMITRGFPSISFTHMAAQNLGGAEETYIYYFGDHDSYGLLIEDTVRSQLEEFGAPDFHFERVAVTADQVDELGLMTRPDKSGKTWAVEVDAIEPDQLRQLCWDAINVHVDQERMASLRSIEEIERSVLNGFKNAALQWDLDSLDEDELLDLAGIAQDEGGVAMVRRLVDDYTLDWE
ncbi:MAG: hypothetical protein IIC72_11740 [Acidobacteria bacterium]|nr:hypothetical protein [Acidobacteriota bacterium]